MVGGLFKIGELDDKMLAAVADAVSNAWDKGYKAGKFSGIAITLITVIVVLASVIAVRSLTILPF